MFDIYLEKPRTEKSKRLTINNHQLSIVEVLEDELFFTHLHTTEKFYKLTNGGSYTVIGENSKMNKLESEDGRTSLTSRTRISDKECFVTFGDGETSKKIEIKTILGIEVERVDRENGYDNVATIRHLISTDKTGTIKLIVPGNLFSAVVEKPFPFAGDPFAQIMPLMLTNVNNQKYGTKIVELLGEKLDELTSFIAFLTFVLEDEDDCQIAVSKIEIS